MDFSNVSARDLFMFTFALLAYNGIPWLLRIAFPAWYANHTDRRKEDTHFRQRELEIKREISLNEIRLKEEISERNAVIEERNYKMMERMEKYLERLSDVVAANTMQINNIASGIASLLTALSSTKKPARHKKKV